MTSLAASDIRWTENDLSRVLDDESGVFTRYETGDGEEYFVEVGTETAVWELPPGGKVVGDDE